MRAGQLATALFPTHRAVRWVCAAALIELAACAPDATTSPSRLAAPIRNSSDVSVAATEQVLYDQPPVIGENLFTGGSLADAVAVDFVIPPGGKWTVSRIVVIGQNIDQADILINLFKDDGTGHIGDIVTSSIGFIPSVTPNSCCVANVYDYSRRFDRELAPGRYWITNEITAFGRRRFNPQYAATKGLPAQIGDNTYHPWVPLPDATPYKDFAFQVYGTAESPVTAATNFLTTIRGFGLPDGTFTSFQAKVNAGLAALAAGNSGTACSAFQDLINAVSAQSGKKLTEAQAKIIIDEATRIRAIIGC